MFVGCNIFFEFAYAKCAEILGPCNFELNINLKFCNPNFNLLLLQSALQPLVGFWPAELLLSLLSRKVFTECCCQQHVKHSAWKTSD